VLSLSTVLGNEHMGDPLVSILTTVLNRVETMGACLASIARQMYRPIEHIVVDGGSADGT
jgi:glycosyltransferase involved in cell wall biosynthesis